MARCPPLLFYSIELIVIIAQRGGNRAKNQYSKMKIRKKKKKTRTSTASKSLWSARPRRWQPNRLLCPWDSPGKNTGVGCHFLLQCMKVKVKSLSCALLLATPWTAAYQAPPSMGFSRQEYWSGVPLPSPEQVQILYIQ